MSREGQGKALMCSLYLLNWEKKKKLGKATVIRAVGCNPVQSLYSEKSIHLHVVCDLEQKILEPEAHSLLQI